MAFQDNNLCSIRVPISTVLTLNAEKIIHHSKLFCTLQFFKDPLTLNFKRQPHKMAKHTQTIRCKKNRKKIKKKHTKSTKRQEKTRSS